MMADITWRDIGALLTVATIVGGLVIGWVRWRLSGDFASRADIGGIQARIDEIETRVRSLPNHDDLRRISERLGSVERGVDVVATEVRGLRDGISRVEQTATMLLNNALAREAPKP